MNGTLMREEVEKKLAAWETLGSILWFAMDALWLFESQWGVYLIVGPTVLANAMVFRYTERTTPQMSITAAMISWVLMNGLWIIGDFNDYADALILPAKAMCGIGVLFLLLPCARKDWRKDGIRRVFRLFRRLRLRHA